MANASAPILYAWEVTAATDEEDGIVSSSWFSYTEEGLVIVQSDPTGITAESFVPADYESGASAQAVDALEALGFTVS